MRCITFSSISLTSIFCMMPGYGSPSYFTTHHWLTWDSSAAFDSRPGSGILSSSACEGPNSIEVRLKQEQGPAEQKQLRILDCINLDLLVRTWTNQRLSYKWKNYLNYFKVQHFNKIIILFVTLINKYKIHFIFRLPLFLIQMFWVTYMKFHCPWYCEEMTWDDFLNYCYFRFLNFNHFYFGFPWNSRHERLCIGYDPPISNKSVFSSPMPSAGPFPWPASRKFYEPDLKWSFLITVLIISKNFVCSGIA